MREAPPPSVRPLRAADLPQVARMHARELGLPAEALPLLESLWEVLLQSPLALATVVTQEGRIQGFVLATSDRQRLACDLWSRRPGTFLAHLGTSPRRTLRTLRFLLGGLQRPGTTAEILAIGFGPEPPLPALATGLLRAAVDGLSRQGAREIRVGLPEDRTEAWNALESRGFREDPETPKAQGRRVAVLRGLAFDPSWTPGPFTTADRLRCALRPEMLVILPIYGLVLIPFASLLAWAGCRVDELLGLPEVLPFPWNLALACLLLGAGGGLLFWSYTFLILEGEGGPVPPFSAKTRRLVRTGPYRVVRHPSILAKLLGVTGLGLVFNSWSFLAGILPVLLAWSLAWNGSRQDGDLIRVFGQEYLDYRQQTPMLFPRPRPRKR